MAKKSFTSIDAARAAITTDRWVVLEFAIKARNTAAARVAKLQGQLAEAQAELNAADALFNDAQNGVTTPVTAPAPAPAPAKAPKSASPAARRNTTPIPATAVVRTTSSEHPTINGAFETGGVKPDTAPDPVTSDTAPDLA